MKPLRLRKFNTSTKSKAIMDVCWRQLKGNKEPYLIVNTVEVKEKGKRIYDYQEQKRVIKSLCPDMYQLLSYHLADKNQGVFTHFQENCYYHYQLTVKCFAERLNGELFTEKDKKGQINSIKKDIKKGLDTFLNKYFKKWESNATCKEYYNRIIEKDLNCHYYTRKDRLENLKVYLSFKAGLPSFSRNHLMRGFDLWASEYLKSKEMLKALDRKPAIPDSELWTIERFCNVYPFTEKQIKSHILEGLTKDQFLAEMQPLVDEQKQQLDILSDQYQIPTIRG